MNPLLLVDSYKIHHQRMYPEGMTKLYSNLTPRKSRIEGVDSVVVFGIQHFILEYLIKKFDKHFFRNDIRSGYNPEYFPRSEYPSGLPKVTERELKTPIIEEYKRHCPVDTSHIEALWDLGYLPIEIKALEEGTICPIGVPLMTLTNTHSDFGWLVNYIETLLSCVLWQPITSATIAYNFRKLLNKYAKETTGNTEGVQWQGHDFSMRGMSSPESAILSGMGHLLSFTGTDTIPAIYQLEDSYFANGLIGASVPATEHSVMCMGAKENEIDTFKRLLEFYPNGILSVVSDTWDLWKVLTEYLPQLKDEILARDGKLVIRPDSGDPVDIICGFENKDGYRLIMRDGKKRWIDNDTGISKPINENEYKGVIELLWDVFGGTVNEQGYKVLDSHIGAIYGDSINMESATEICERLKDKGFASTNIVFGIGSYTYQFNTRDTFGFAMKATYGEIICKGRCGCGEGYTNPNCNLNAEGTAYIEAREIFKDPITDDGTKKSARGLLMVHEYTIDEKTQLVLRQQCKKEWVEKGRVPINWEEDDYDMLTTVFKDGKLTRKTTLEEIRNKLNQNV